MSKPYSQYRTQGYIVLNSYIEAAGLSIKPDDLILRITRGNLNDNIGLLGYYYTTSLEGNSRRLDSAMKKLAVRAGDQIPQMGSFFDAMKAEMDSKFIYTVKFASEKIFEDAVEAANDFGKLSLDIIKFLPTAALLYLAFIIYKEVKKV